jgi:hypothetical protein
LNITWIFLGILPVICPYLRREFLLLIYTIKQRIDRGLTKGIFSVIIGCKRNNRNNVKKNKLVMFLLGRRKSKPVSVPVSKPVSVPVSEKKLSENRSKDLKSNKGKMGFSPPHPADIKMTNKYRLWSALHSGKKLIDGGVPSGGSCGICEKGRKIENGMPCPSVRLFYDRTSKTIYSLSVADFEILMFSKKDGGGAGGDGAGGDGAGGDGAGDTGPDFNHFCFEWVRYV